MNLTELQKITMGKTPGKYRIGNINKLDSATIESDEGFIIATVYRHVDQTAYCTMANHFEALIAIAELVKVYAANSSHTDKCLSIYKDGCCTCFLNSFKVAITKLEEIK
jgi:hypothetical protein